MAEKKRRSGRQGKISKWHLKRLLLMPAVSQMELTIPGEPLPYSMRDQQNRIRKYTESYFVNNKKSMRSLLRSYFPAYLNEEIPLYIKVIFYVSPVHYVDVPKRTLKAEKTHATRSFEVCDYLLSLLEYLFAVLFKTYRQIVKIDAEKIYSDDPRTVFKFMRYEHFVKLQNNNPIQSDSKAERPATEPLCIQSPGGGDAQDRAIRESPAPKRRKRAPAKRAPVSDVSFQNPGASELVDADAGKESRDSPHPAPGC